MLENIVNNDGNVTFNVELHCCDNLELLSNQPSQCVDLIYCDILYGTDKKFKDYVDLKPEKQIIYDFYWERLNGMWRVLKETGTIYLQMDMRILHWIRCMMDDIFGYNNFRNQIIVTYNIGGRGRREFAKKYDCIVVYSKSNIFTFNDSEIRVPYKSVISKAGSRPNITPEKLELGTIPTNVWIDVPSGLKVKKMTDYYSEKHEKILERIIKASSNADDLVVDYFMGSGTTAAVCKKLGRRFIGCDINDYSIKVVKNRIK